jgi:HEPN domain-containing protein
VDVEKIAHYWLTTGADDLKAADHLFQSGDYTHALFFGHLYLEKLLKAYVVRVTGEHAPITHNLRFLAKRGRLQLTADQLTFLGRVSEYTTKVRYPDMELRFKRQCTEEFSTEELKAIKEFGLWLKKMMIPSKR